MHPLYPILDTATLALRGITPETAARGLLDGGARILQFRHKGHFSREMFETAKRVSALCKGSACLYVIDDRTDIALLVGAGVHLGQDDLPPSAARRLIGPHGFIAMRRTQTEIDRVKKDLARLDKENAELGDQVRALKTDPRLIEKIAREDLQRAKPGEIIIRIPPSQQQPAAGSTARP